MKVMSYANTPMVQTFPIILQKQIYHTSSYIIIIHHLYHPLASINSLFQHPPPFISASWPCHHIPLEPETTIFCYF